MRVMIGDRAVDLDSRGYAFGPRGVPHGFASRGTAAARLLLHDQREQIRRVVRETSTPASDDVPPNRISQKSSPRRSATAWPILGPMPGALSFQGMEEEAMMQAKRYGDQAALKKIDGVRDAHVAAINSGDAGAWTAQFAEDAIEMPPHSANIGKAQIGGWSKGFLDAFRVRFSRRRRSACAR